jgi:hypothetical protein
MITENAIENRWSSAPEERNIWCAGHAVNLKGGSPERAE